MYQNRGRFRHLGSDQRGVFRLPPRGCNQLRQRQLGDTFRRALRLLVGPYRNDLRQLAEDLRWLEKLGLDERAQVGAHAQEQTTPGPSPSNDCSPSEV
jgi:hypothetical protein